jgi:quercetin dioxygenase-like cupin family protein
MYTQPAEIIRLGGIEIRYLVDETLSRGSMTTFEVRVAAGAKVPVPHSHDAFDETIYGLAGVTSFTVGGATHEIQPGQAVFIPRGVVHGFINAGAEEAVFLAVATPGVFGPAYFRELRDLVAAAAGGPPDRAGIMGVMQRHGLTPAAP